MGGRGAVVGVKGRASCVEPVVRANRGLVVPDDVVPDNGLAGRVESATGCRLVVDYGAALHRAARCGIHRAKRRLARICRRVLAGADQRVPQRGAALNEADASAVSSG